MAGSLIFRASSARSFERDEAGIRWRKSELGWRRRRRRREIVVLWEAFLIFQVSQVTVAPVEQQRLQDHRSGGMCRQERVGQGWMDIEACIEEGERGRDAKEELQTLALDLFQTAYRAFRPHIRHDLLYSPAPPYVEATVRSFLDQIRLVDYRCARVYLVESFHGSRGQSSRDDQSDQSNWFRRYPFRTSWPFFVGREWKKERERERWNRELNRFDGEIVSFDSWKSRPPLFHFFVFLFNPLW